MALHAIRSLRMRATDFRTSGRPSMTGLAVFAHQSVMWNNGGSTGKEAITWFQVLLERSEPGAGKDGIRRLKEMALAAVFGRCNRWRADVRICRRVSLMWNLHPGQCVARSTSST